MKASKNDIIKGYTHPTKIVSSRGNVYKTFTEGAKAKKKEKFGSTISGNKYMSSSDLTTDKKIVYKCPECSEEAVKLCQCGYSDKTCPNGHVWYNDREGNTKVGNPH